jgi:thiamine biosynthesis lipoprotein
MGTTATLQLAGADSVAIANLAYDALVGFHHVDSLLSNWTEDSEIARVNRKAGSGWVTLHPELRPILSTADTVYGESIGAFDLTIEPLARLWGFLGGKPHVPPRGDVESTHDLVGWQHVRIEADRIRFDREGIGLDLGGIAKGYGVDLAAARLDAAGASSFLLDLSGNMIVRGAPPQREVWRIGIRDPRDLLPHLGTLAVTDVALATSGDYEQFVADSGARYGHILDPRTGWPAEGMAQVTVLAGSAMLADAWSTALFVLGPDAARELAAGRDDLSCILIERGESAELTVWIEESLRSVYTPHPDLGDNITLRWF